MCFGSSPKAPAPPPRLPQAPTLPDVGASMASAGADTRRRKRAAGKLKGGTILTGSRGIADGVQTTQQQAGGTILGG
jgi:hypothetical protein